MENLFYFLIVVFAIIGWYILINQIVSNYLFTASKIDKDVKIQIRVKNKAESIEYIIRYIQEKLGNMQNIEIIDENSIDETYEILQKIQKQYQNIKVRKIL